MLAPGSMGIKKMGVARRRGGPNPPSDLIASGSPQYSVPMSRRRHHRTRPEVGSFVLAAAICWLGLLPAEAALAEREHTVTQGQTLGLIAHRYRISVMDLCAANRLSRDSTLRLGQVLTVPEAGVVYVQAGQTLSGLARRYETTVAALVRLNHLRSEGDLRLGQRLVLPGHQPAAVQEQAERRWGRPRSPGVATLLRVGTDNRLRIRLVSSNGRVRPHAVESLARFLRPRRGGRSVRPDRRLLALLARASDHFGGRTIQVVSGYRPEGGFTRETSRHTRGRAIDFRVEGVPNTTLRDYLRTLDRAGVGYYPNSSFVHLDVRDERGYWVDESRAGEAPSYVRRPRPGDAVDGNDDDEAADDHHGSETTETDEGAGVEATAPPRGDADDGRSTAPPEATDPA